MISGLHDVRVPVTIYVSQVVCQCGPVVISHCTGVCEPGERIHSILFSSLCRLYKPEREAPCFRISVGKCFGNKEENIIKEPFFLFFPPGCCLRLEELINYVCCFLLDV